VKVQDTKFDTDEAAAYLGVNSRTLETWRMNKTGPLYYKPTSKLIYYFKSDLDEWIKSGEVKP